MFALATAMLLTGSAPGDSGFAAQAATKLKFQGWSREELTIERDRLDLERPTLRLPLGFLFAGGGCLFFDLQLLKMAGEFRGGAPSSYLAALGVVAGVGLLAITIGLIVLYPTVKERNRVGVQMDELTDELDRRNALPPAVPPVPEQGSRPAPWFEVALARF